MFSTVNLKTFAEAGHKNDRLVRRLENVTWQKASHLTGAQKKYINFLRLRQKEKVESREALHFQ